MIRRPKRSTAPQGERKWFDRRYGLRFWFHDTLSHREGAGGVVGSHVFQHVGCRLNRSLTNLVHADRVPAVLANHRSAACDGF